MAHTVEYDHPIGVRSHNVCNEALVSDFLVLCLWPVAGLVVTATLFVAGFADELTRALAVAG
jgi:hypothetical protein